MERKTIRYAEVKAKEKEGHIGHFDNFKCKICKEVCYFGKTHLKKKHGIEIKWIIPLFGSKLTEEASKYLEKWDKKPTTKEEEQLKKEMLEMTRK